ncbi:MAG: hypothetical protein NT068_03190 [Candidatus Nomurabacteria bacterium]|nr:hypothetical protein [Candidatus Nomurabacteria bacterium]
MPVYKKVNKDFFKKWSPEMAYVLGFLFADGNIVHTKRNTWFWSLQITDKDILIKIKKEINSSHKVSFKKKVLNNKQLYRLQIGSKEMCEDLIKLGLTPQKSKTMIFPQVPEKYFSDFLRGYFDGDGGVWFGLKNKKNINQSYVINVCFTSGSKDFLIFLRGILNKKSILGGSLVEKERGFDLKYSIKNSLILYKIMYNSNVLKNNLFLERKRAIFEKFICLRS